MTNFQTFLLSMTPEDRLRWLKDTVEKEELAYLDWSQKAKDDRDESRRESFRAYETYRENHR